jgi:predicted dehydrogenase
MKPEPLNVGIIGCGNISRVYLDVAQGFPEFRIVACADLRPEAARKRAQEFHIHAANSVDELLADPRIDLILNLTTPDAHADVALAALQAGKSIYNEKPLALSLSQAEEILKLARTKGLRVGCAPDTFLGAGLQTCRRIIDEGEIGVPVAATAFMMSRGHEHWHPNPAFYYKPGGGPLFDMGPYYLTALVALLGPVRRVTGMARISRPERVITSQAKAGARIKVEVPTHVVGVLEMVSGVLVTIITSFDVQASVLPHLEIYGTTATLWGPDPNRFGGPVRVKSAQDETWRECSLMDGFTEQSRGLGVADMVEAMRTGQPHRANGDMAYHVLEVMHAVHGSSEQGRHIKLSSTCERPAPFAG